MSSDSAENCSLAATRMRCTSSCRQSSGRSRHPPDRTGVHRVTVDGTSDQGHGGVLADAQHDAIGRQARTDDEHAGRGQRTQEEAQDDASHGDDADGDDDCRDELGHVGLGHSEGAMQERADRQGEHATAADTEGELAELEERAGLEATVSHAVGATQGQCDDDCDGEERVDPHVRQQPPRLVHRRRGVPREDEQGEGECDAGADEVAGDLHERQIPVVDGARGGRGAGTVAVVRLRERGWSRETRLVDDGVRCRPMARLEGPSAGLDLGIRAAHRLPIATPGTGERHYSSHPFHAMGDSEGGRAVGGDEIPTEGVQFAIAAHR